MITPGIDFVNLASEFGSMPIIQCDIREGRTEEQKRALAAAITRAVSGDSKELSDPELC